MNRSVSALYHHYYAHCEKRAGCTTCTAKHYSTCNNCHAQWHSRYCYISESIGGLFILLLCGVVSIFALYVTKLLMAKWNIGLGWQLAIYGVFATGCITTIGLTCLKEFGTNTWLYWLLQPVFTTLWLIAPIIAIGGPFVATVAMFLQLALANDVFSANSPLKETISWVGSALAFGLSFALLFGATLFTIALASAGLRCLLQNLRLLLKSRATAYSPRS